MKDWFNERPVFIQELIKKFPIGIYIIKEGAPYRLTFPGSKVIIRSYCEDGSVSVFLRAEDKTAAHEKFILK